MLSLIMFFYGFVYIFFGRDLIPLLPSILFTNRSVGIQIKKNYLFTSHSLPFAFISCTLQYSNCLEYIPIRNYAWHQLFPFDEPMSTTKKDGQHQQRQTLATRHDAICLHPYAEMNTFVTRDIGRCSVFLMLVLCS